MSLIRMRSQGRLTIPNQLRKKLALEPGALLNCAIQDGQLMITPVTSKSVRAAMGFLKPRPGEKSVFDESLKERARERRREEAKFGLITRDLRRNVGKTKNNRKR